MEEKGGVKEGCLGPGCQPAAFIYITGYYSCLPCSQGTDPHLRGQKSALFVSPGTYCSCSEDAGRPRGGVGGRCRRGSCAWASTHSLGVAIKEETESCACLNPN